MKMIFLYGKDFFAINVRFYLQVLKLSSFILCKNDVTDLIDLIKIFFDHLLFFLFDTYELVFCLFYSYQVFQNS